jgi:glucose/arabinose dehydrogenase
VGPENLAATYTHRRTMTESGLGEHRLELVADGFSFPTSLTFDEQGVAYVAEAGLPFGGASAGGAVWRLSADGARRTVAEDLRTPVNGLTWHDGVLYLSEGGHPARLSRLSPDGTRQTLLDGLPGPGNYHLNMATVGPDEKLYFSQGAMTNLGFVGLDAYDVGWLRQLPHGHDVPGFDIRLAGLNITTEDPTAAHAGAEVTTGAFVPFGTSTEPGQRVSAGLPATASVMRCHLDGSGLELVAWGLRNAYGLGFLPDGRLLAIDQGADDRGSRPIGGAPDLLFDVRPGSWYGWPDYIGKHPVTEPRFRPERGPHPSFILAEHDSLPPPQQALLEFPPHVAAVKFDLAPPGSGLDGSLLVALFGDELPMTAPGGAPRVDRGVALVDTTTWRLRPLLSGAPLRRPIDVRVRDGAAYVLDFGHFEITEHGVDAVPGTGRLWRLPLIP